MRGALGLVLGLGLATIIGCGPPPPPGPPGVPKNWPQYNEITALWTQIRDWRHQAHMELDPPAQALLMLRDKSVRDAERVCPDGHQVPATCGDVCNLADDICDNAERICEIADQLGKQDDFAQQKCTSAKASCREAKQRCCECSGGPT
jgi:hypothetical protein